MTPLCSKTSHSRRVLSQELEASTVCRGLKETWLMGPSCEHSSWEGEKGREGGRRERREEREEGERERERGREGGRGGMGKEEVMAEPPQCPVSKEYQQLVCKVESL